MAPSCLALLLVRMSFGSHFGQSVPIAMHWLIGSVCPTNGCVAIGMGLPKMPPKLTCHGEVVVPW